MLELLRSARRWIFGQGARSIPVRARHAEYSAIVSLDDDPAEPSERLLDVALNAASMARQISMRSVVARMPKPPYYPDIWPGEHYKLLAAIVAVCRPKVVIEIGTAEGLSALAMAQTLPAGRRVVTFDLIPWNRYPGTVLTPADFTSGAITQVIGDLSDPAVMQQHAELVSSADLIFSDGPKDGRFEQVLLDALMKLRFAGEPILILDDVRVWSMLGIWRRIQLPKLDVTSFGHWTGTGLVDLTAGSHQAGG